jgi:hypothetical protein
MAAKLEDFIPVVRHNGLNTDKDADFNGAVDLSGATVTMPTSQSFTTPVLGAASATTINSSGNVTVGGLVGPGTQSTVFHTGGVGPGVAAFGTDTTPVVTETYICQVDIPENATLTGLSVLNGSAVSGNIQVGLANSAGAVVASSASTNAGSGTNAYQAIPFSTTYTAVGPAKYFALVQYSATTARYRTHILGNFGAAKKTSETYGTLTTVTPPTTFATAGAIVCDTY